MRPADTSPEAWDRYNELLAQKTPAERVQMLCRCDALIRAVAVAGIRQQHPEASEAEVRVKLAERLWGPLPERLKERIRKAT